MANRKLSAQDVEAFRGLLNDVQGKIRGDIHHLEADALGGEGERAATDGLSDGRDSFDQEFSLELLERDEATLDRVQAALDRITAGTFGRCERCEGWISKTRLKAVPYAEHCIECQRLIELEAS